ncbi:alpha/beta fold hydrolase [Actinocorallia lasiicapitis]
MRLIVAALLLALLPSVPAHAAGADRYPVGGVVTGVANLLLSPDRVAGANDWKCRPSAARPRPVVLMHAMAVNLGFDWAAIAPTLANAGHCVYAFNYGMARVGGSLLPSLGRLGGLTEATGSARELARFVDRVLEATGAAQVDIVGHSQGGMLPNYYIKRLGGAPRVHTFVALAPTNHGTTLHGAATLIDRLRLHPFAQTALTVAGVPSIGQQLTGSPFQRDLFADGDTVPGPRYVVLATRTDEIVTPHGVSFLKGARNLTLQDLCPGDLTEHIFLTFDRPVVQTVVNELGAADPGFRPDCG